MDLAAVPYWIRPIVRIRVAPKTTDFLVDLFQRDMPGVIHLVDEHNEELLEAVSSRALGRAALSGVDRADRHYLIFRAGELFGERWLPAEDFGVERVN